MIVTPINARMTNRNSRKLHQRNSHNCETVGIKNKIKNKQSKA
jgi:hypothetical protein